MSEVRRFVEKGRGEKILGICRRSESGGSRAKARIVGDFCALAEPAEKVECDRLAEGEELGSNVLRSLRVVWRTGHISGESAIGCRT
jgi:hypothetical protein